MLLAAAALAGGVDAAQAQLRIVQYNTGALKNGQTTVYQQIGNEQVNGIAKPIDILITQEQGSTNVAEAIASLNVIRDALNGIYGADTYGVASYPGGAGSTGGGFPGMIYRVDSVDVIGQAAIGTVSGTSANARHTIRYQIRPDGYDSAADFYIYASHYKSDTGTSNQNRRNAEATSNRANADAMPTAHIIYAGDFNFYTNTEPAYVTLTSGSANPADDSAAVDPTGTTNWTSNTQFNRARHTQSPATSSAYPGQVLGGMDDRFDFQLTTAEVQDGLGFSMISGSYRVFGNNGTHNFDGAINVSNEWTATGLTVTPQTVLNALAMASDHVPVVADYQIPAKMSVNVTGSAPAKVITGTPVTLNVNVANTAPVSFINGADTLDYSVSPTGAASGVASGSDAPLGGSNDHTVTLATATAGNKSGVLSVTTTSQGAAGNNFSQNYNYQVVDPSNASFSTSSDVNAHSINFGYVPQGFAARSEGFVIAALVSTPSFTARLDLDSVNNAGSTASLSTNVMPFTNRNAGSSTGYSATLATGTAGVLSATHTFNVSDENIAGETVGTPLVLTSNARVISSATFPVSDFLQLNTGETYNTGPFSISNAGVTLQKLGPGTMNIDGPQSNAPNTILQIGSGTVNVGTDGGSNLAITAVHGTTNLNAPQHLRALTVSGALVTANATIVTDAFAHLGGKLDLKSNKMIVRNGDTVLIAAKVAAGRNGGNWNGSGIITSEPLAAGANALTTLAVASASDVLNLSGGATATWAGETVGSADTLLKYTYNGDANLSGNVDADDYFQINAHYGQATLDFFKGDFNYSGFVDADDYFLIDAAFIGQGAPITGPAIGAVTAVPEPVFGFTFALAAMALQRRRRASN